MKILEYLLSMKGVGNKTAACVLVFSLGRDVFPVDTHIHRICNRLGLVRTKSADQTYDEMQELLPSRESVCVSCQSHSILDVTLAARLDRFAAMPAL